jgi:hypothetical protein
MLAPKNLQPPSLLVFDMGYWNQHIQTLLIYARHVTVVMPCLWHEIFVVIGVGVRPLISPAQLLSLNLRIVSSFRGFSRRRRTQSM